MITKRLRTITGLLGLMDLITAYVLYVRSPEMAFYVLMVFWLVVGIVSLFSAASGKTL